MSSPYFLIKKSWDAVSCVLHEDTDLPGDIEDGVSTIAAYHALTSVHERYKFIVGFINRRDGSCSSADFELVLLTICPPEEVDLAAFRARVEEYLSKTKAINRWLIAYEQRGTLDGHDVGRGRHCHILCDVSAPTSFANFKRSVGNHFRPWYWTCYPKLREWEAGKIAYLNGNKQPSKKSLVEADCAWRIEVGLEPTEQSGTW